MSVNAQDTQPFQSESVTAVLREWVERDRCQLRQAHQAIAAVLRLAGPQGLPVTELMEKVAHTNGLDIDIVRQATEIMALNGSFEVTKGNTLQIKGEEILVVPAE